MNIAIIKPNEFCSQATCITIQCTSLDSIKELYFFHEVTKTVGGLHTCPATF